jgi:hypothetical protein
MLANTNVLDPVFVLRRTSQRESRVVLECGGLTPLSFCVSFAFCAIAVGGAERKKGTAKAASSHRTPKKRTGQWGTKIVTFPEYKTGRKRYKLNAPGLALLPHSSIASGRLPAAKGACPNFFTASLRREGRPSKQTANQKN